MIYLTPNDGSGRVIGCYDSATAALILEDLKGEGVTDVDFTRGDVVCDFCSTPDVRFMYQIRPGGGVGSGEYFHADSDGRWGACLECHALIQRKDWVGLANRSAEVFTDENDALGITKNDPILLMTIAAAQLVFRQGYDSDVAPARIQTDFEFLKQIGIGG